MTEAHSIKKPFHEQLGSAAEEAGFTVADLSVWFDRSYATVRYWLIGDPKYPQTGPRANRKEALKRLLLLEWALKNVEGFPISPRLTRQARADWVRRLYVESRRLSLSQDNPPVGGV